MTRRPADRLARMLGADRASLDPFQDAERPSTAFESAWRGRVRSRVTLIIVVLALWLAVIEVRLVDLQIVQHADLTERALKHQQLMVKPEALRGDIVDRHGDLLAYSVEADSIAGDPSKVDDPVATAKALCGALGDCTAAEQSDIATRLSGDGQYTRIRQSRAVSPAQAERVAALKLKGIVLPTDTRRYYPRVELAANVLGFVGLDNNGQAGLEYAYDKVVHGEDGLAFIQVDAKRQRLDSHVEKDPIPGATLELTLDMYLQHIAERELAAGVAANHADGGTAIIMNPATGEVLAMASYPTFNPNAVGRADPAALVNRATQNVYEPGSTFKIVTASAALEEHVVTPSDLIDTRPGSITFPGRKPIYDTHSYGVITFEDVIVKSSNVGAIKVGLRTGAERLTRYVHRFGFGQSLAPDFSGASRGIWTSNNNMTDSTLASVSMGYQVSVTALQMATAASAVANGGLLMEPHIVGAVIRDGHREPVEPKVLRRAIEPETAATLTGIMEGVVSPRGTAHAASLDDYQVAGKTGTAHKVVDGHYSTTDYTASFVGFVPSRNPQYTILVVVDTPRAGTYYGGTVAAPVFKRIADAALRYAGVPTSINPLPPVLLGADGVALPARPVRTAVLPSLTPVGGLAVMPDVRGESAREALRALLAMGLTPRLSGSGFVVAQSPAPGAPLGTGMVGALDLARVPADEDGFTP